MKIKLVQPGWETFSDLLGFTLFKDGVSVEDVSPAEAARLASIVSIETLDGKNPSPAQMILDTWSGPMAIATTGTADSVVAPAVVAKVWVEADLAAVADKSGIKGLREIADPLGVKANSIPDLIAKIVAATKPAQVPDPAAADPVVAPVADAVATDAAAPGSDATAAAA
jgi:hypothetical protein